MTTLSECPNRECGSANLQLNWAAASAAPDSDAAGYILCRDCGCTGPLVPTEAEAARLWNALPRYDMPELIRASDLTLQALTKAQARIAELTNWRPMESAPEDDDTMILVKVSGAIDIGVRSAREDVWYCFRLKSFYRPDGWLPLPSTTEVG